MVCRLHLQHRANFVLIVSLGVILAFLILITDAGIGCAESDGETVEDSNDYYTRGLYRTWHVDNDAQPGGNGTQERPFSRIQDAIDNSSEGDTVRVFNGTYYENPIVNISLRLIGNGSSDTIIDGNGTGNVVTLNGSGIAMTGFAVMNSGIFDAGIFLPGNNWGRPTTLIYAVQKYYDNTCHSR